MGTALKMKKERLNNKFKKLSYRMKFSIPFDLEKRELQKEGRNFQKAGFPSFIEYIKFLKSHSKKELALAVSKGKHPVTINKDDII